MADLPLLQAGPPLTLRQESVPVPALGGSVIVRGLTASEAFACSTLRDQALRRVHLARAEHAERVAALAPGQSAPEFEPPALTFDELRDYGRYVGHMLAVAVTAANGLGLYTAEQWEMVEQTYPGTVPVLQAAAERLSGFDKEDVRKNSTPSPS